MVSAGYAGRVLQGAGSAFAFTGAVYLAAHSFSRRWLATAIGVTQCLGILYSIIKEVNRDEVKGSATGGINFPTFGVTALVGPIFADLLGKAFASTENHMAHFRAASRKPA